MNVSGFPRSAAVVRRVVLSAAPGSEFKCVQSRSRRVVPQQKSLEINVGRAAVVLENGRLSTSRHAIKNPLIGVCTPSAGFGREIP